MPLANAAQDHLAPGPKRPEYDNSPQRASPHLSHFAQNDTSGSYKPINFPNTAIAREIIDTALANLGYARVIQTTFSGVSDTHTA